MNKSAPDFDGTHPIIVFDGVCVLCSGGVSTLIKRDKHNIFRFATAQSTLGKSLLTQYECATVEFDTVLLVSKSRGYIKSDFYIEVARLLGGGWSLLSILRFIPKVLRDWAYDVTARNRYKWFGKTEYCARISDDIRDKFLDM